MSGPAAQEADGPTVHQEAPESRSSTMSLSVQLLVDLKL